jgi:hypothetical protein
MVAEDGDVCTQVPLDEGGGTDFIQTDAGGDLTVLHGGGEAIHATSDIVGKIKNNTSGDEIPDKDDEGANLLKTDNNRGGNAIHATVDAVGEADVIKNNTSGDENPVTDVEGAYLIKYNTSSDGIHVQVDDEAELTKKVGTTEGLHTMEEIIMTNQDRFDYATVDEEVTRAEEEFEGF